MKQKESKAVYWYKYRYDILSGSGGTMGSSGWKYVAIPERYVKGKDLEYFLEAHRHLCCEYKKLEIKSAGKVPMHVLEEEFKKACERVELAEAWKESVWKQLGDAAIENDPIYKKEIQKVKGRKHA